VVEAENGPSAKNKAITLANRGFEGAVISRKNYKDPLWGINKFPELVEVLGKEKN